MTIGTEVYRVQYTFDLGTDGEVAVTGFHARWVKPDDVAGFPEAASILAAHAYDAWTTGFGGAKAYFPTTCHLASAKVYHIVPTLHSDGIGVAEPPGAGADWTGTATASLPWECSLVMTTETDSGLFQAERRRKRGRLYLPPMGVGAMAADGLGFVQGSARDDLRDATFALLEAWNDAVGGVQTRAVVYSVTGGFTTDITAVSADNKIDAQRRRENREVSEVRTRSATLAA